MADLAFLVSVVLAVALPAAPSLVQLNRGLKVGRGQSVFVTDSELRFEIPKELDTCKVEVVLNEPATQRVGKLSPQVFDCHFLPDEVKYVHNGSPLLGEDKVMLRLYRFTESETTVETFLLEVQVTEPKETLIQFGPVALEVPEFHGLSNSLDSRVVSFKSIPDGVCTVRLISSETNVPAHGELIVEDSSRAHQKESGAGTELRKVRQARPACPGNKACSSGAKEVHFLKADCDAFLQMGLRYQHLSPPSPEVDYVSIRVEIRDKKTRSLVQMQSAWIPAKIRGAIPNQQPRAAFMSMFILEVDQFILTPLSTAALDAEDDETPQSRLVFNVTKPPIEGYLTHLDDHTKQSSSFTWQDLHDMKIAYQPPNSSHSGRRNFEVEFVAIDDFFAESPPIMVHFSIRSTETNAPRVSWNMGLDLLEGQSRPISWENFQIVDNDNINSVYFVAVDGPQHGRLTVRGGKGFMFKVQDIKDGTVRYHHGDSDTTKDYIVFRVSDGKHSIRHKFPINILPKDDTPPFLINNMAFEVQEGAVVLIEEHMLLASDLDSSDDYILYQLTVWPRAGEIVKKPSAGLPGFPVKSFLQRDLFHGLIYYQHLGGELFEDSFEFTLSDGHEPPNLSQTHVVVIHISPVKDQLPKEVPGTVRAITVKESDIAYITKSHLHFRDVESPDADLMYFVTQPCFVPQADREQDAGKLFFTDSVGSKKKDPSVPLLKSFTQHAINHLKVGYMPPLVDIGPSALDVQFIFSVSDQHGGTLSELTFNITVLPVDNQAPEIFTNPMKVEEGAGNFITSENLLVADVDTNPDNLRLQLKLKPRHGHVELNGSPMLEGDVFTLGDLRGFRVRYQHDDSETLEDTIWYTCTDGFNSADGALSVKIIPVNDEAPELKVGLKSGLECPEGGHVLITADFLYATDADSDDTKLTFMLARSPSYGVVHRGGRMVDKFSQQDIIQGLISYVHTGGEVGPSPCLDALTLIVSDGEAGTVDSCCLEDVVPPPVPLHGSLPVYDLNVTVLPVNNQAPSITVGDMFIVDEGSSTALLPVFLQASDEDTFPEALVFLVGTSPQYGYLENTLPSPGHEKSNAGLSIASFSLRHLKDGHINYVQSRHKGVEPTADHFTVSVSDGVHHSMAIPFYVIISPKNDERPWLLLGNMTVLEGGIGELTSSVLDITDLDAPPDILTVSVVTHPHHGTILKAVYGIQVKRYKEMNPDVRQHSLPVQSFTMSQLQQGMKLIYVHDDTESLRDSFSIQVTDGKHTVQGTVNVHILPVNDEKPHLLKNAGLTVDVAENKVISSVALEAEDKDTPRDQLVYVISKSPTFGQLQLKTKAGWLLLLPGMNFTQEEVDMNRLWYLHTTLLGSEGHDSFRFYLTDHDNESPAEVFHISLLNAHKGDIALLTKPVTLTEGDKVTLTTDVLLATDGTGRAEELQYAVSAPPAHGHIEFINYPGLPITDFSQLDVAAQKVCYVHDNSHETGDDFLSFVVSNGLTTKSGSLKFVIKQVDRIPPTLLRNRGLQLLEGTTVTIGPETLELGDPDTPMNRLVYSISQHPRHGQLLLKGRTLAVGSFTQLDVNNMDVTYRHDGGKAEVDHFGFVASDGTNDGFLLHGQLRKEPMTFTVQVEHSDKLPPRVVTKVTPSSVEDLKDGRFGVSVTSRHLKASDGDSRDEELEFVVIRPPFFGYLENTITGAYIRSRFTQKDLDRRAVRYVIDPSVDTNSDSFEFKVTDAAGNSATPDMLEIQWSRIELASTCYRICENGGTLSIQVSRSGISADPAYVAIQIHEDTARLGQDFTHSSATLIQFDPGVTTKTWKVFLKDDGLEENDEKFQLQLKGPRNAVLGMKDKATVEIVDPRGGRCEPEELPAGGSTSGRLTVIPEVLVPGNSKPSLETDVLQERHRSPPRGDVPQTDHFLDYGGAIVRDEAAGKSLQTFHGMVPLKLEEKTGSGPARRPMARAWSWHTNMRDVPQGDSPVVNPQPQVSKTASCPEGWTLHGGRCYFLSDKVASWTGAEMDCGRRFQSHLVSVHSSTEMTWLRQFAKGQPFWIGLRSTSEGITWTNGHEMSYARLKPGTAPHGRRCVATQPRGTWHWRRCSKEQKKYICAHPVHNLEAF
ncbi:FRAS1-related extracellular matrix protein 1b [Erpetoichthys calabaricus]|uniref:FRAS1-related extracellular matrix protein 1b n=1 Tax=Erpetoichthys calabaricus TaxID=27687 RepID=UPI0010A04CC6|nr:FRAS1-related extracellular matrix protein 1b [Erpetoichthys calabaricus]